MKKHSFVWILVAFVALCAFAAPKKGEDTERLHRKARYFYLEGQRCQLDGNPSGAYACYSHALAIDPEYTEASSALGSLRLGSKLDTLQSKEEVARSLSLMRPFVDKYPEDFNESMLYAYFCYASGNYPEAIRVFQRTEKLHPSQSSTLVNLARAYMAEGEIDSAINTLSRFERIEGFEPSITIQKVSYRFAKRDTIGAINEVSNLVASNPREPNFLILKGNVFNMIQQTDSALNYFQQAETLNPDNGAAKLALADFYRQQGDSVKYDLKTYEALVSEDFDLEQKIGLLSEYLQTLLNDSSDTARGDQLFETLRSQYPHNHQVLDLSARYSAAQGNYKEAIDEIGYAISLSPSDEKMRGQMMSYLLADDKPKEAMKVYQEVKKFNPTPIRSLTILYASAAQMAHEYLEGVKGYGEIVHEIAPSLPLDTTFTLRQVPPTVSYEDIQRLSQLYTNIGDCYFNAGMKQKAYNAYENAITLEPENVLAMNNYAYFLSLEDKDLEKARELSAATIVGDGAQNPTYLDTYAWILYKAGDYEDARKYQEQAIEYASKQNQESEELYSHYGDILTSLGDNDTAIDAYKKALTLYPDEKMEKELKDKIKKLK